MVSRCHVQRSLARDVQYPSVFSWFLLRPIEFLRKRKSERQSHAPTDLNLVKWLFFSHSGVDNLCNLPNSTEMLSALSA
jgi:hypothetical protein